VKRSGDGNRLMAYQAKPSQAKPSQAKPSQACARLLSGSGSKISVVWPFISTLLPDWLGGLLFLSVGKHGA